MPKKIFPTHSTPCFTRRSAAAKTRFFTESFHSADFRPCKHGSRRNCIHDAFHAMFHQTLCSCKDQIFHREFSLCRLSSLQMVAEETATAARGDEEGQRREQKKRRGVEQRILYMQYASSKSKIYGTSAADGLSHAPCTCYLSSSFLSCSWIYFSDVLFPLQPPHTPTPTNPPPVPPRKARFRSISAPFFFLPTNKGVSANFGVHPI